MKTNPAIIKLLAATAVSCAVYTSPAAGLANAYINLDLGPSFVNDVLVKNTGGGMATFDPGICGNLCLGYRLSEVWAVEFETGVLWNSIDKIAGVALSTLHGSGELYQIPLKLNLICNVPTKSKWTPYFGAGAGAMASILESRVDPVTPAKAVTFPIGNVNFCDTDFTFAYQAIAGLKYNISAHAQVDLGYKFFGTFDHNWSDRGFSF